MNRFGVGHAQYLPGVGVLYVMQSSRSFRKILSHDEEVCGRARTSPDTIWGNEQLMRVELDEPRRTACGYHGAYKRNWGKQLRALVSGSMLNQARNDDCIAFFRRMHELGIRRVVFSADGTVHTRSKAENVNNKRVRQRCQGRPLRRCHSFIGHSKKRKSLSTDNHG